VRDRSRFSTTLHMQQQINLYMCYATTMALLLLTVETGALANGTNEVTLLTFSSRRQSYKWRIPEDRLRADRTWDIRSKEAPLQLKRAVKIADAWLRKRSHSVELVKIEIQSLAARDASLAGHYIYILEYLTGTFDSMAVVILMDGTVVEPVLVPRQEGGAGKHGEDF
jgi:hypothetical protein